MLDIQIREKLAQYLLSRISLREFLEWFTLSTLDVDRVGNDAARELSYDIESALAEFTNGHITEQQLRHEFLAIASNYTAEIEYDIHIRVKAVLSSATRTIRFPFPQSPLEVVLG